MTIRGAKSGKLRYTPLMRVEHDGRYALVASKGGAPEHPTWYRNLVANPHVELQDGTVTKEYDAREVERRRAAAVVGAGGGGVPAVRGLPAEDGPADPGVRAGAAGGLKPPRSVGGACHTAVMSTQPVRRRHRQPDRPLTVAEYLEIGEVEPGYTELAEGRLVLSPSPKYSAQQGVQQVRGPARRATAAGARGRSWTSTSTCNSVPADAAGNGATTRRDRRARRRHGPGRPGGRACTHGVGGGARRRGPLARLATPGPALKRDEYADAGIPHYWIVDLDEPVSLIACHLAGEFGYVDGGPSPASSAPPSRSPSRSTSTRLI